MAKEIAIQVVAGLVIAIVMYIFTKRVNPPVAENDKKVLGLF